MAIATFGAGCFWGVEEAFRKVPGVTATAVGYSGGHSQHPSYKEVCTGRTGHAEVCQVTYEPKRVSYEALLDVFWSIHDPTTRNRQGPDVGTQYRSAIFFHDAAQERAARASKKTLDDSGRFHRPIVTEIAPAAEFWKAEAYHQQYIARGGQAGCTAHPPDVTPGPGPATAPHGRTR